jgi:hypothetical protein
VYHSRLVPITAAITLVLSLVTLATPGASAAQRGGNELCVAANGGTVVNETVLDVVADGGTAIGDASGGQGNLAAATASGDDNDGNRNNNRKNNNNGNNNNNNGNNNNNRNNNRRDWSAAPMQTTLEALFQEDTASSGNAGVATAAANGGVVSIGDVNSGGNSGNAIAIGDTVCPGAAPAHSGGGDKGGGNAGGGGQGGQVMRLPKTGSGVIDAGTAGSLALALGALGMAALAFGYRDDRRFFRLRGR